MTASFFAFTGWHIRVQPVRLLFSRFVALVHSVFGVDCCRMDLWRVAWPCCEDILSWSVFEKCTEGRQLWPSESFWFLEA